MCGIAGIFWKNGRAAERATLEAMARAMAHRGPDGEGFWIDGAVGLAHRRLAIIDLETGEQPMGNEDGRVQVVFNGEIYNFLDLWPQLTAAGHRLKTRSDTEVLVHGFEEWGTGLAKHLNGMFAFAIADRARQRLYLARDRLGVKPLYYYASPEVFVFASELHALMASGLVPRELDPEALELYLHYQYVPSPLSIYRGVSKLEPGQWLELDLERGTHRIETYWDIARDAPPDHSRSLESWMEELHALLDDAVRIRLISDVPFGAFLSGGTDSGITVAMMAGKMAEPVKTFSIGLAGEPKDELPWARKIAERYRTDHTELEVAPEGLTLIPKLAPHFGEPFADSSAIPTYYVSKLARERVKMVLTGDGGDELFAGYRSYAALAVFTGAVPASPSPPPWREWIGELAHPRRALRKGYRVLRRNAARVLRGPGAPPPAWYERHDVSMQHFGATDRRALLGPRAALSDGGYFARRFPLPGADTPVAAAQYVDLKSYLPGDVLAKVDRMSMASSLEVRSPLLDYRLAELAFSMPTPIKMAGAALDGSQGKRVLKEVACRYLGRDYVYRPKEGFGIPVSRWLREDRHGYLHDTVGSPNSPVYGHLDGPYARRMIAAHVSGLEDHAPRVWNLLMLDAWLRAERA